jgi:hypothetical protein
LRLNNNNFEQAMDWLLVHSTDESNDIVPNTSTTNEQEVAATSKSNENEPDEKTNADDKTEAKSIKCEDCNRLFKTQLEVEFHASKSGHMNFSESTEEKKPLTEEEKKAQMALLEEKLKQKRLEREENEKREALEREKLRIKSGKDISEVRRKLEEDEMKKIVSFFLYQNIFR